jgi:hypothetical protein
VKLKPVWGVENGVNPSTNEEVTVEDAGRSRAKKHFIRDGLLQFVDIWKEGARGVPRIERRWLPMYSIGRISLPNLKLKLHRMRLQHYSLDFGLPQTGLEHMFQILLRHRKLHET